MLTKIENMKAFESFLERFDKDITWKNDLLDIDYPYKIRNRIIYSGCYLCYFSNHLLKNNPTKPLPADESINYKVFKSITTGWTNFIELNNALVAMNSSSFREKTNNFRNSEHHTI